MEARMEGGMNREKRRKIEKFEEQRKERREGFMS